MRDDQPRWILFHPHPSMTLLGILLLLTVLLLAACTPGPTPAPAEPSPATGALPSPTLPLPASLTPLVEPTSTAAAADEGAATTYDDERCSVRFQIPPEWQVNPADTEAIEAVTVIESMPSDDAGTEGAPLGLKVQLRCTPAAAAQTLRDLVEGELARERQGGNPGVATPVITDPEPATINGYPALTSVVGEAESSTRLYYLVHPPDSPEARFVVLSFTPAQAEAEAVAALLASFEFVEQ